MTPQALTALKQSIEHWRRLATGQRKPDESVGASHCALCREFNPAKMPIGKSYSDRCGGCPVAESGIGSSRVFCTDTPWVSIEQIIDGHSLPSTTLAWVDSPEARALAAEELAFLESLLPEDFQK